MESYWEDITPARAAELLRTSKLNRSLNQNWVATLSRDMRSGHWVETPQGLVLDEQGNLLDGQHRLNAVRRADMTVRFWVTKGVPAKMFRHLDGGRGRSMADRLGIDRYSDATQLAAISRKVFAWQNNQPW